MGGLKGSRWAEGKGAKLEQKQPYFHRDKATRSGGQDGDEGGLGSGAQEDRTSSTFSVRSLSSARAKAGRHGFCLRVSYVRIVLSADIAPWCPGAIQTSHVCTSLYTLHSILAFLSFLISLALLNSSSVRGQRTQGGDGWAEMLSSTPRKGLVKSCPHS